MDRGKFGQEFKPTEARGGHPGKVTFLALSNELVRSINS